MTIGLGIDIGTSGIRAAIVTANGEVLRMARADHRPQYPDRIDANLWWDAVRDCVATLKGTGAPLDAVTHLSVDGTSGTLVLVDEVLQPVAPALMYNTSGFVAEADAIAAHAEPTSITLGQNSALARLLRLQSLDPEGRATHALSQCDFVLARLAGRTVGSDANNMLKLGYDPEHGRWPEWLELAGVRTGLLPGVHVPGTPVATIAPDIAAELGLAVTAQVVAGTTDSIAAFLAARVDRPGEAVTSLGTTLAVKLLSTIRVDDPARGVYSHRLGGNWLAGGASNTGGGVIAHLFPGADLHALSARIDPSKPSGLDYYPLIRPGERFPINDPELAPRLSPRPRDDAHFLHGVLEAMARIESQSYAALEDLGASPVTRIVTAGGGASNPAWTAMRRAETGVPIEVARDTEAAVGTARLAMGLA